VFELYLPKFQFTKCFFDFVTKYAYFLHENNPGEKNQRRLFSQCSDGSTSSTCYQKYGPRRLFYFSAGQCTRPQSQIDHQNAKKRHSRHYSHIMVSEQYRFESCRL